jgi:hypothetical protein
MFDGSGVSVDLLQLGRTAELGLDLRVLIGGA